MAPKTGPGINSHITDLVTSRAQKQAGAPPSNEQFIPLDEIRPSPYQPPARRDPPVEEISQLAANIKDKGQLQNILVRRVGDVFELMGGERRWRAFQLNRDQATPDERSRWQLIRAEVREASDKEAADLVAVENLHREGLTPLDEGFTYAQLMQLHGFTQAPQLAAHLQL